ncbi:MAG: ParB/RepB/Spo0J family partition protein [Acidobacteriia bacterium]|nr:ParB/RepB/Spo0J family partition protein [Terriglobia bacterium]
MAATKKTRRKKTAPLSIGLTAPQTRTVSDAGLEEIRHTVEADGGAVLGAYSEPFGGKPVLLAALPINKIEPTPYQRDASETHIKRLMDVIEKIGRFLDPVIAIPQRGGGYWTPNGNHRLQALRKLGARSITALLVPEMEVAFKILALNTEKAHNLKEKSLETIRMARALAGKSVRESDYAFEFEEPAFLTLGPCYEKRPRFSGSAYLPVLKRIEEFSDKPLGHAIRKREERAAALLALDDQVTAIVKKLQARGFTSPYLKVFVIARINPIRFSKAQSFDFDEVLSKMEAAAGRLNIDKVREEDIARSGGPAGVD